MAEKPEDSVKNPTALQNAFLSWLEKYDEELDKNPRMHYNRHTGIYDKYQARFDYMFAAVEFGIQYAKEQAK